MALGIALRVTAMAFVACLWALAKWIGGKGIPVFEIVFFRNAFAFIPVGIYIWRTTGFEVVRTRRLPGHLTRATMGLFSMACGFGAVARLPLTEATAFQFAAPLFMTAMSALMLKEFIGRHRWAAVVVGFLGVLIMARPHPGNMNLSGVALALMGAIGSAGAMIAIRQIAGTERGATIVFWFTLAGTVLGAVVSVFHWVTPDPMTLAALALCGIVGGIGQLLLTEAIRLAPVGVVAPFDYTQLIWATAIGFLVWGELPRAETIVGAIVVAASGAYILHREIMRFRRPAS